MFLRTCASDVKVVCFSFAVQRSEVATEGRPRGVFSVSSGLPGPREAADCLLLKKKKYTGLACRRNQQTLSFTNE